MNDPRLENGRNSGSYGQSPPPPPPPPAPGAAYQEAQRNDEHRTMALIVWVLLLAGIFTFLAGIAAVFLAYAKRRDAPELWRGHYNAVIKMFWIWLILTIIGVPLTLILIGYIPLAIAVIWTAAVGVTGLIKASQNRPA